MICPILEVSYRIAKPGEVTLDTECLQEDCAWWQKELQNCIIYQMGMEIGTITCFLEEIKDKMPHVAQFVK